MFKIFATKTEEELLCEKYTSLMHRSFEMALTDKKRSDELNERAKKILGELRRMQCQSLDRWM